MRGEELLANWFGWTNRALEASAVPEDVPWGWRQYAYRGYLALQQLDQRLLEGRLPAAIFYNLMVAGSQAGGLRSGRLRPDPQPTRLEPYAYFAASGSLLTSFRYSPTAMQNVVNGHDTSRSRCEVPGLGGNWIVQKPPFQMRACALAPLVTPTATHIDSLPHPMPHSAPSPTTSNLSFSA